MNFKEFMIQSLTVTIGMLIFLILVYIILQITTSEGFRRLSSKKNKIEDMEDDDDFESVTDEDDL